MEINSLTNSRVKQWVKYKEKKYREQDQCFLVEGEHLVQEAHHAGLIEQIIIEQGKTFAESTYETFEVSKEILKKLSDCVSGTWIMAVCHYPQYTEDMLGDHIILLDNVQDPGNVGTMIRTALSFGFDSVVLSDHAVDIYNEKVMRSTQGALFHLPVMRMDIMALIPHLKKRGIPVYATALRGAKAMATFEKPEKIALVFGNEGNGVRDEILSLADEKLYIEMHTFESLNVAVAAGICMYYFKK